MILLHAIGMLSFLIAGEGQHTPVDIELVLAADVSVSMDANELRIQQRGFAQAFRDDAVVGGIISGARGCIAVTYFNWSGPNSQTVVVPWRLIDSPEAAARFADDLDAAPVRATFGSTALGSALAVGALLMQQNTFEGQRRIIDIAGDGESNRGPDPRLVRDLLVAEGITINGLALTFADEVLPRTEEGRGRVARRNQRHLGDYFRDHVIGGSGAFVEVVSRLEDLETTLERKLVREIARWPTARHSF